MKVQGYEAGNTRRMGQLVKMLGWVIRMSGQGLDYGAALFDLDGWLLRYDEIGFAFCLFAATDGVLSPGLVPLAPSSEVSLVGHVLLLPPPLFSAIVRCNSSMSLELMYVERVPFSAVINLRKYASHSNSSSAVGQSGEPSQRPVQVEELVFDNQDYGNILQFGGTHRWLLHRNQSSGQGVLAQRSTFCKANWLAHWTRENIL